MKTPAPVACATGQPTALRLALLALVLLLAVVGVWWAWQQFLNPVGQVWRTVLVLTSVLWVAEGLRRHLLSDPRGTLRFDGERWWYLAHRPGHAFSEQPVLIQLIWDAQTLVCVRMQWDQVPDGGEAGKAQTVWLFGNLQMPSWLAMRRALLATARIITPHATTV